MKVAANRQNLAAFATHRATSLPLLAASCRDLAAFAGYNGK